MKTPAGLTRAQTLFLQAYLRRPGGPGGDLWPAPGVLRRWLRSRGFAAALASVRAAQRVEAEMHLTATAASAARTMHDLVTSVADDPQAIDEQARRVSTLMSLMRLAHVWHRFARTDPTALPEPEEPKPDPYRHVDPALLAEMDARFTGET